MSHILIVFFWRRYARHSNRFGGNRQPTLCVVPVCVNVSIATRTKRRRFPVYALNIAVHRCLFSDPVLLISWPGEGSCRFDSITDENEDDHEPLDRYPVHSIVFYPAVGSSDSRCSCDTIDR